MEDYRVDVIVGGARRHGNSARAAAVHPRRCHNSGGIAPRTTSRPFWVHGAYGVYDESDLELIVARSADLLGVQLDSSGAAEIAGRSRGTPRIVNRLLRRVRDYAQVHGDGTIDRATAQAALALFEVDADGL